MSQSSHRSEPQAAWQRWLLAALVICTLVFGSYGNWIYERKHAPDHLPNPFSVFYHSSQLLIMHGVHLHEPVPFSLHVGRLAGTAALFTAGMIAFARFFRNESLAWWLRRPGHHGHVVICGLGELGLRLALDARERDKFVVAIETHANSFAAEQARRNGVLVIEGDARDPATLEHVKVDRAEFLVAVCPDDATNVAIAAVARDITSKRQERKQPLVCRLLLRDAELRRILASHAMFDRTANSQTGNVSRTKYRVNFHDLDLQDTAARQVFRRYPLDFQPIREHDDTAVHLVIVGFGQVGSALALQAARIGHFANAVSKDRRIRITIVDNDAKRQVDGLRARYSKMDHVCDLTTEDRNPTDSDFIPFLESLSHESRQRQELFTYAVCFETVGGANDRENFRIAAELARQLRDRPAQTLVYQNSRAGLAAVFTPDSAAETNIRLHAFGMAEDIYSWDVLLHESEDRLAKAIHADYRECRRKEKQVVDAWEQLSETLQESNRHAADHIPVKLRALGYHDAPLQSNRPRIQQFAEEEKLLLAKLEHRRWCAERWLDNWEYGPVTIREKKINQHLIDWSQLSAADQRKDFEQIEAIPRILLEMERGIYR